MTYTPWNELSPLEQAAVIYSDMHKDTYGFRPRSGGIHNPTTLADYEAAFESMGRTMEDNAREEEQREAAALAKLESELDTLVSDHAIDRATALRWWFEAEGTREDDPQSREHVLWARGIAFSDFPKFGEKAY